MSVDGETDVAGEPEAGSDAPLRPRTYGLRVLRYLWAGLIAIVCVGGAVLQYAGPPEHSRFAAKVEAPKPAEKPADRGGLQGLQHGAGPPAFAAPPSLSASSQPGGTARAPEAAEIHPPEAPAATSAPPPSPVPTLTPAPAASPAAAPAMLANASIAAPDPGLLESSLAFPGAKLPRIGADRRTPMTAYAAAAAPSDQRPRIAILLGGIGESEAASNDAADRLPAAVSFVVSPYTLRPAKLLEAFRAKGHEMFLGLPMEPQGYPVNDEGDHAMLTGAAASDNANMLEWAMGRIQGYVGATNALDGQRGGRFASSIEQMQPVLETLTRRGLMYVDAGPAAMQLPPVGAASLVGRGIDILLDDPPVHAAVDAKLSKLEQIARAKGSAIGLVALPHPVTISELASWADGLSARGFVLAPVSAIVQSAVRAQTRAETSAPAIR